jgi:hypothetical protein
VVEENVSSAAQYPGELFWAKQQNQFRAKHPRSQLALTEAAFLLCITSLGFSSEVVTIDLLVGDLRSTVMQETARATL